MNQSNGSLLDTVSSIPTRDQRWRRLLLILLTGIAVSFAAAQSASALSIGLMTGDDLSWQSESGWNSIQHSAQRSSVPTSAVRTTTIPRSG